MSVDGVISQKHPNWNLMQEDQETDETQRRRLLTDLYGQEVPSMIKGELLRTSDVARLFQVSERTVSDWARRGRIPSVRTPGGHRRYPADEIHRLMAVAESGEFPVEPRT